MNAVFKIGKVKVLEGDHDVEKDAELVTLSGGYLGKDDFTRPVHDDDRLLYKEEYAAFKRSLETPAVEAPPALPPPAVDTIDPAPKVG